MDVQGQTSPFLMDSVINFRCDKGLFPAGDMSSTCDSVGGVGIWRPDTNIICRDIPGEHAVNYIVCIITIIMLHSPQSTALYPRNHPRVLL